MIQVRGTERWKLAARRRALASDRRAGVWTRGEARRRQREYLARKWRRLAVVSVVVAAIGSAGLLLLPAGPREFAAGSLATGWLAALMFLIVQATGTAPMMMGDTAEQWTAGALRRLCRRGWCLVNHITLTEGDIDHVLVGPGGAYAVETKWRSRPWDYDESLGIAAQRIADNARRLRLWGPFRRAGIDAVTPVIVMWGEAKDKDRAAQPRLHERTGTWVVAGAELSGWIDRLPQHGLTNNQIQACWRGLELQARKRDAHEEPCPPSATAIVGRTVGVVGTGVAAFLVLAAALPFLSLAAWALLIVITACAGLVARRWPAIRRYATGWVVGCVATAGLAVASTLAYYAAS